MKTLCISVFIATIVLLSTLSSGCICCCTLPGSGNPDSKPTPTNYISPTPVTKVASTPLPVTSTPMITPVAATTITPTQKPTPLPEITWLPTGTYIARNANSGDGELSVENGLSEDAVILLASELYPKKTIIGVYVRAGDSFTITGIPDGNYIVYDRIGLDWDINANKFTRSETSERFGELLSYETTSDLYTAYEITMQKVVGGNANTYDVSDSNMPSI